MKKIRRIFLQDKQVMKKEEMGHVVAGDAELWLPESGDEWGCQNLTNAPGTIEDWTGSQLRVSAPNGAALIAGTALGLAGLVNTYAGIAYLLLDLSGYGLTLDLYEIAQNHMHNYLDGPHTPIGTKSYKFIRNIM